MPKTIKRFDWEIYDENGDFFDILSMTRSESKDYQKKNPKYTLKEIGYNGDGDFSWESNCQTNRNVFSTSIRRRR